MKNVRPVVGRAANGASAWAEAPLLERARGLLNIADGLKRAQPSRCYRCLGYRTRRRAIDQRVDARHLQLRLFSDVVADRSFLDVRIDKSDPDLVLGVRPGLRSYLPPRGPILNFATSSFLFSVTGGDTASTLTAGCSVIVKAHSGHPRLSAKMAHVVSTALVELGASDGVFQLVARQAFGVELLGDKRIAALSFTGSIRVDQMLAEMVASRPKPIPFYGERGSVNPVFITEAVINENRNEIVERFTNSIAESACQLRTKLGFLFLPRGHNLDAAFDAQLSHFPEHRLLNPSISAGYHDRRQSSLATGRVSVVTEGPIRLDDAGSGWATPTVVRTSIVRLLTHRDELLDEAFGPLAILVDYDTDHDLALVAADLFDGNLTTTIHIGLSEDTDILCNLLSWATHRSGPGPHRIKSGRRRHHAGHAAWRALAGNNERGYNVGVNYLHQVVPPTRYLPRRAPETSSLITSGCEPVEHTAATQPLRRVLPVGPTHERRLLNLKVKNC